MFSKKYVFETRYTRSRRLFRNIVIVFMSSLVALLFLCMYIPMYAKNQNAISREIFFKKAPDVIAVYTGDAGRLDLAFKKAEQYPSAKIFITGVYSKNNLKILLEKQGTELSVEEFLEQESHHIELDYLARNTVENGLATLNYLSKLGTHSDILIISSDYHIFRINLIMQTLLSHDSKLNFYYEALETDYTHWRNLKILFKEVYKLLKTTTFLIFWDKESPAPLGTISDEF